MKVISEAAKNVMAILGKPRPCRDGCRLIKYCVQERVDEGVLFFNTLTRELLLLDEAESADPTRLDALKERWFVVPQDMDERQKADQVRWILRSTAKSSGNITHYTIMTTTDCNARCFYCFELGRSRIPMSEETAHKTARYIRDHCGGEKVKIMWFGGEPLFNRDAIDIICEDLRAEGVDFHSGMASNGYLFDADAVEKAGSLWNLESVQITLDGTEEIYNRSKAYIYRDGNSPYRVVMDGIGRLLDAGIRVRIRLNLDLYNAENMMALVDELAERFSGKKGFTIYGFLIFDGKKAIAHAHSDEEWVPRYEALQRLNDKIRAYGLDTPRGIGRALRIGNCMVDHGKALVIAPTGEIGLCEHYSDSEFVGHIDGEKLDAAAVQAWRERCEPVEECNDCFCYPECVRLKKCTLGAVCFRHHREENLRNTRQAMRYTYRLRQQNMPQGADEEETIC